MEVIQRIVKQNAYQLYIKPLCETNEEYKNMYSKRVWESQKKVRDKDPEKYYENLKYRVKKCYDSNEEYRERKKAVMREYYQRKKQEKVQNTTVWSVLKYFIFILSLFCQFII